MNVLANQSLIDFEEYALKKAVSDLEFPEILEVGNIGDKFMDVLENGRIKTLFQPIISLKDGSVFGYEALSRGPADTSLENPAVLFDLARVFGKLWELELLCRIKALEKASRNNCSSNIFINVDPNIINDEKFKKGFTKEYLKKFTINPENIIFEITEKNVVSDIKSFKMLLDHYKDQGYKIAIDDTGSGYSGLKLITDIHPHYIKLDMNLIRNLDQDGVKYSLIKTLYEFCMVTNIKVIAEGIETENEMTALIDIGVDYGQGYFIQKPAEDFVEIRKQVLQHITEKNQRKSNFYYSKFSSVFVSNISRKSIYIEPCCTNRKVAEMFNDDPSLLGIPVVDNGKPAGLIMKDKFFAKLGTQYGFAVFSHRPVMLVMDKYPLCIDAETSIDMASRLAVNRTVKNLYDYIIIEKNGSYHGIVTVKDLLEKTIELEVDYAKHLNPLSGLPGNMLIEQKLKEYVSSGAPYTILYIDIDNFKVYNDVYGFERGDKILKFLSRLLIECFSSTCTAPYFIGHIGGDDFVVAVESYDVDLICSYILEEFKKGVLNFYTAEHLENGFIVSQNRYGQEEKYNITSLSIAGVNNKNKHFNDIYELSEHAGKIKRRCKEVWDNCFILD